MKLFISGKFTGTCNVDEDDAFEQNAYYLIEDALDEGLAEYYNNLAEIILGECKKYDPDAKFTYEGDFDYNPIDSRTYLVEEGELSDCNIELKPLDKASQYKLEQSIYTLMDINNKWEYTKGGDVDPYLGDDTYSPDGSRWYDYAEIEVSGVITWSEINVKFELTESLTEAQEIDEDTPAKILNIIDDWWGSVYEMVDDLTDLGYDVEDYNDEYITITDIDDQKYTIYLDDVDGYSYIIKSIRKG